jgi:hypothetical protein
MLAANLIDSQSAEIARLEAQVAQLQGERVDPVIGGQAATVGRVASAIYDVADDEFDDTPWSELSSAEREVWECYARAALRAATQPEGEAKA